MLFISVYSAGSTELSRLSAHKFGTTYRLLAMWRLLRMWPTVRAICMLSYVIFPMTYVQLRTRKWTNVRKSTLI